MSEEGIFTNIKNFYNEHKTLCIALAVIFAVVVITVIIIAIVFSKRKNEDTSTVAQEDFTTSISENADDKFNYANTWVKGLIGDVDVEQV